VHGHVAARVGPRREHLSRTLLHRSDRDSARSFRGGGSRLPQPPSPAGQSDYGQHHSAIAGSVHGLTGFMESAEPLLLRSVDGGAVWLTLNRPSVRNAINSAMRNELLAAVRPAGTDPNIRVVVIRGAG